jgi:hypothetical protein
VLGQRPVPPISDTVTVHKIEHYEEAWDKKSCLERQPLSVPFIVQYESRNNQEYYANAIETQIWVTMIAYLLLRVMQHKAKSRLAFSNKF